jgi:hypothetical protein
MAQAVLGLETGSRDLFIVKRILYSEITKETYTRDALERAEFEWVTVCT